MFQHNRSLHAFINSANEKIQEATSQQDLLDLIESARIFNGRFQFDQRDYLLYFLIDSITLISGIWLFQKTEEDFWLFITALAIMVGILLISRFLLRRKRVAAVAQSIFYRKLLFDHNLQTEQSQDFSLNSLNQRFSDFNLGNHSRHIESILYSRYLSADNNPHAAFSFRYYHLHYVDEHIIKETDKDGKTTTRTVLEHHDRFGLIVPIPDFVIPESIEENLLPHATPLLTIQKRAHKLDHKKSDYLPASLEFRDRFQVITSNPHIAAKFLKPTIVELLLSLNQKLSAMRLEISPQQELLLSFNNDYLGSPENRYDLNNIDAFLAEMREITTLPEFHNTLKAIAIILNESDNNFS